MRKNRFISASIIAAAIGLFFSMPTFAADSVFVPEMTVNTEVKVTTSDALAAGETATAYNDRTIGSPVAVDAVGDQVMLVGLSAQFNRAGGVTSPLLGEVTTNYALPLKVGWRS